MSTRQRQLALAAVIRNDAAALQALLSGLGDSKTAVARSHHHKGRCPLIVLAAVHGRACLPALIEAGALVDECNVLGDTPLMIVAMCGAVDSVRVLLRAGANVCARNHSYSTVAHAAVLSNSVECLRTLVDAGAPIDRADEENMTPLHVAAERGLRDMVATLLELGADPLALDHGRRTPRAFAGDAHCGALLSRAEAMVYVCTLLPGTRQPASPLSSHFSALTLYDPRLWRTVAQFLGPAVAMR
jgi:ankyrin repeat protein